MCGKKGSTCLVCVKSQSLIYLKPLETSSASEHTNPSYTASAEKTAPILDFQFKPGSGRPPFM